MDIQQFGKTISHLRMTAGYTQKTLADALGITDKAVSKWERGLACPDISLLPQLSALLDVDMDILFSGLVSYRGHEWVGVLVMDDGAISAGTYVYDKPLVYYLLSLFLLVGINQVSIIACERDQEQIRSLLGDGSALGVHLMFSHTHHPDGLGAELAGVYELTLEKNVLLCHDKALIYGMNMTRQFQAIMGQGKGFTELALPNGTKLPFQFCGKDLWRSIMTCSQSIRSADALLAVASLNETPVVRGVGRGMTCLPLDTYDGITDAASFVRLIQAGGDKLYCIEEIAWRRGFISTEQLTRLANEAPSEEYRQYLLGLK